MYLVTILAFAVVFWQKERPLGFALQGQGNVFSTLVIVLAQPPLLGAAAWLCARRVQRVIAHHADAPQTAQRLHHRSALFLRTALIVGFAASVLLTPWPDWFAFGNTAPVVQILGDLIVLSPFLAGVIALWLPAYPLERTLRAQSLRFGVGGTAGVEPTWRLRSYLDFNLRHQVLIVAVPMTLILFAADLTRGYASSLRAWTGRAWTPDALLGVAAAGIFLMAPVMLARIWQTFPLEPGPVRERLEELCRRVGMRCRDILVWHSDGMMINAAVMGVCAQVRYVLLSDGLLATMSATQIEAVFAHEAGHVRHRHMQHFLVFAFVGWLLTAGAIEWLAPDAGWANRAAESSLLVVQGVAVGGTILFWGVGFGWLSRRFERQADLFGARCMAATADECRLPCSVHLGAGGTAGTDDRVCATGVAVYASALDRVALLNGIPLEERSWRHSSIGSRIRFLTSLAGDPGRTRRFVKLIRRVKIGMLTMAITGVGVCAYYWT